MLPWDARIRRQFILSLSGLVAQYGGQVELDPVAADRIYEVAKTAAPNNPGTLLARATYLYNAHRGGPELEGILSRLKTWMPGFAEVWVIEGAWAFAIGDHERSAVAVKTGLAIQPLHDLHKDQLNQLAQLLKDGT